MNTIFYNLSSGLTFTLSTSTSSSSDCPGHRHILLRVLLDPDLLRRDLLRTRHPQQLFLVIILGHLCLGLVDLSGVVQVELTRQCSVIVCRRSSSSSSISLGVGRSEVDDRLSDLGIDLGLETVDLTGLAVLGGSAPEAGSLGRDRVDLLSVDLV